MLTHFRSIKLIKVNLMVENLFYLLNNFDINKLNTITNI